MAEAVSLMVSQYPPQPAALPVNRLARLAMLGDQALNGLVATTAALLVLAEIGLLGSGVFARYVLEVPLVWSDELASILFLWLSMLGAVLALRRGDHMRMTGLVNRVGPRVQALLEAFALAASLALLIMIISPAIDHAQDESFIVTPALEISSAWRASALPAGVGLMIVAALFRLAKLPDWRNSLAAIGMVAAAVLVFWLVGPSLVDLDNINLLIFFVGVVAVNVFAGVPIAFSFALATYGYLALTTQTPVVVMVGRLDEGMSHEILLAIPLFIFLGALLEMTGMARAMIAFLASLLGRVRGGLSYVLIGAMYLVSGISGSKVADMAAIAPVLLPEMQKRGARPGDLLALLAATGAQTETIPPSIVLITIGSVTGVSIAALFTGGLLPAAVLGIGLCLVVWWRARGESLDGVPRLPVRTILRAGIIAVPSLLLPFVIRTAVIEGVATATEVSTIGIVYAAIMGLAVYRQFEWRRLPAMLVETASLTGTIIFIIGSATAMAWGLTQSGFSQDLAHWMARVPGGQHGFLAISIVVFVVLGSVLEGIPAIVLFGPLLFPVARAAGVNDVHYAMVVVFAMGIGLFSPPFGVGYYGACAISKIHPDEGLRHMGVYVAVLMAGLILVAAIPWLSTGFL
jgi:tripartite ATP-independent transporter DctM subunit